jgi:hypothetical protein
MRGTTTIARERLLRLAVCLPFAYWAYRLLRVAFTDVLSGGQGVGYYAAAGAQDWGVPAVFAVAVLLLLLGSRARIAWIIVLLCSLAVLANDMYYHVSLWVSGYPLYVPLSLVLDVSLIIVAVWSTGASGVKWKRQHRTSAST